MAATNLQTSISEQELSAREDFHRDLEEFFACQPQSRRLYYERRSRQYSQLQDIPKTRVISMSQLARVYLATFLGEPDRVGHFRQVLEKRGDELFRNDHLPVAYYAAAAMYYQLESLIRNGKVGSDLSPARYHILSAMKLRMIGSSPLPRSPKKAAAELETLLDTIWTPHASERVILDLLPALRRSIDSERSTGTPLSEMVRTRRFTERVRQEVLGALRPFPGMEKVGKHRYDPALNEWSAGRQQSSKTQASHDSKGRRTALSSGHQRRAAINNSAAIPKAFHSI